MSPEHRHAMMPVAMLDRMARPPEARVIEVVAVDFRRGEGCCDEDPVRIVTAYYAADGTLLAENDPTHEHHPE